jgi:hypothetical protein
VAFTPTVGGDINGDGLANDRAFIPGSSAANSPLASQLAALIEGAPTFVQHCLLGQANRIAAQNSCRGPWQTRLDVALNLTQQQGLALGTRLHFTAQLINAGAAIFRLLGVTSSILQSAAPPDERLLFVTSFDTTQRAFRYSVNQLFGQPIGTGTNAHHYPPFQVQLGLAYDIGGPSANPLLRRLGLLPDSRHPLSTPQAQSALRQYLRNPVDTIVALRVALSLADSQITALAAISARYVRSVDSVIGPVAAYAAARGTRLTDASLSPQLNRMLATLQYVQAQVRDLALAVLRVDQRSILAAMMAKAKHSGAAPPVH